jgi:hypothetical protein
MRAFKFLESRFVPDALARGRFSIGTLAGFRTADGYDDGRADGNEGITRFRPGSGSLQGEQLRDFLRFFDREHLTDRAPPITFQEDTELLADTDCYLMCFVGQLTQLMVRKMADRFGYRACLQISDLRAFCQGVTKSDERLHVPFPKQPEACWSCEPVAYREKDSQRIDESPFIKRAQFRWQREWRCVWPGTAPHASFLVDAPAVTPLLREVNLTPFQRRH